MNIQIDPHTKLRAAERGATESEISDVLKTGFTIPAKERRHGKAKVFPFHQERNGKIYPEKRIEVYYTIENDTMVTITVYVFYGSWRNSDAHSL